MSDTLKMMFYEGGLEPKPTPNKNHIRVYGHELCPFVQRAYLALGAKEIKFQKCSMNLKHKAQWHLDINNGMIPVMEQPDGTILHESAVLMDFAVNSAPKGQGIHLWPHEAAQPGD